MPYRNEVRPLNLFGDYLAGRSAAIDQQGAEQGNALRGLQIQRAQRLNALASDATPEQYVRAGDAQTGMALQTMNQQGQVDKQQAVSQLAGIAQKALSITDPAQRKSFLQQAGQIYGPAFQALGADMSQFPAMLAMPDDQLQEKLQQVAQFAAPQKPIELAAGASPVNPQTGQPMYTAPGAQPSAIQEYKFAQSQGYKGSFEQFQRSMKQAGAQQINLPSGYKWNADGSMAPIPGGPADPAAKNKPPTEADKKNAVLFSSMTNAEDQIAKLEKEAGATDTSSIWNQSLGSNALTKPLQSDAFRKYESAALRWSANLLYLKSGATATPEEVQSTRKQFFPQPGDGPDVKAQKEAARQQEVESVRQYMVPGAAPRAQAAQVPQFATEQEAEAAGLKPGTRVVIGGVPGTWQ
jgi:hypothetical protein